MPTEPITASASCADCSRPVASKHRHDCGACGKILCKDCTQFLEEDAFSFLKEVPEILAQPAYCGSCYDEKVGPALSAYAAVVEQAQEIGVFYKNERNLPPHRALNKKVSTENCLDRKETLLRLAFFAAEQSCNALVNVELISKKIRNAGYQKTVWSGTGFPARVFLKGT
jgi:hypothetical protein